MVDLASNMGVYLQSIGRLVRSTKLQGPGGLFFEAAAVAAEISGARHAAILIPVDQENREVIGCFGTPSTPLRREPLLTGIVGRAFQERSPQLVPDVTKDPDYVLYDELVQSELAVPVPNRERSRVDLVINLESEHLKHFSQEQIVMICSLGELILDLRASLASQTQRSTSEAFLAEVLDQSPDEVLVIDTSFRPVYANRAKRQTFPKLDAYLNAHPLVPGDPHSKPPRIEETCHFLIEDRHNRCELCVCNRAMQTNGTVQSCYDVTQEAGSRPHYIVELAAAPLQQNEMLLGCIETARQITQRELVLDHSPELVNGVTERQLLENFIRFLHTTMGYERVRLY